MKTITILTPTYNRENYLRKLYQSLCVQTSFDFCWLVVDDGSTDGTVDVISSCIEEHKVEIEYLSKANGGKHTALNLGMAHIHTELTFIVDSDDYLPEDAIERILKFHSKYKEDKETYKLCGYSFLRFYSNGEVNTAYFPKEEEIGTYLQVRINGNIGGDKAEVFYTSILREYPFPVIPGEKFMAEDVVWMQMSEKYQMVHTNQCIYICDYLEEGLTRTGRRMKILSPKSMMLRSRIYLDNKEVNIKTKIKMMLLFIIYGKFASYSYQDMKQELKNNKILYRMAYLPAVILYRTWK